MSLYGMFYNNVQSRNIKIFIKFVNILIQFYSSLS